MTKYVPFFGWIKNYDKDKLTADAIAGLTVGVMLIPQGMAYAMLAGLPAVYGLYAALLPQVIYGILGTSRQLSVGPVAMDSLLVATIVSALSTDINKIIEYAILLAFIVGLLQFLFGLLRLGFFVNFLSKPVISAFTFAAALIIGFNQIKHFIGINLDKEVDTNTFQNLISQLLKHLPEFNLVTLLIGLFGVGIIIILRRIHKKLPAALIIVIFGTFIVYFFNLHAKYDVNIVGEIPTGLPNFKFPVFRIQDIKALLPAAFTLALIGFMEAISIGKSIETKHDDYQIDSNQELIALGASNMVGSFFSSFPVSGGFSRSAVNDQAGAKTGMASIISSLVILFTLLFLTEYFYYLPNALLGSIIIVAVIGLIDLKVPKSLWKFDKIEFSIYLITFLSTLLIGVVEGIGIGVLLSLLVIVYNVSYPHIAAVGKIKGTHEYRNVKRFDDLEIDEAYIMVRLDARLFYANMNYFRDKVYDLVDTNASQTKAVIIIGKAINGIDSSSIQMLKELMANLNERGIDTLFTELKGPIRDKIHQSIELSSLLEGKCFLSIDDAIKFHNNQQSLKGK